MAAGGGRIAEMKALLQWYEVTSVDSVDQLRPLDAFIVATLVSLDCLWDDSISTTMVWNGAKSVLASSCLWKQSIKTLYAKIAD